MNEGDRAAGCTLDEHGSGLAIITSAIRLTKGGHKHCL
jgi:hypothetical protein